MRYTPSSPEEREQMLEYLGIKGVDELYADVPSEILLKEGLKVGEGLSEQELARHMREVAGKNRADTSFLGAGAYRHYIPAAVDHIISRSEFYTSYTPYQAEVSQGVLQALFEYQSMMCELTGQEVCNATMYDGSTALAEACVMAHNMTGRDEILVSDLLHPDYVEVLKSYCSAGDLKLTVVESDDGLQDKLEPGDETAAVVMQNPNYHGCLEEMAGVKEKAAENGSLLICCVVEITSLGLVKPPPADITVCEGQGYGNPLSYGGPSYGVLATKLENVRRMPGRLVGETVDEDGKRGFALTLQAREQHIRREKALSNICTSQSLCGIAAAAHLALLGPEGVRRMALESHRNAAYLSESISKLDGFSLAYDHPFYNEFLVECPEGTYERVLEAGMMPGHMVSDDRMLLCTTEIHRKDDLDRLVEVLG
ncbi:MAG: aminomethyl-transferring glycine dehydrogenase subunit GcvPA [Candidatus Altiarchaeales archaeon]|nr:aminomethyl-transferring glycine dehydrogenase subunit GcvPA [Candidatus Altiarchaeales archaeon]MBD3416013.1 aminomethyl-transferring glycine dehydrogenase subunit GcvPA [Candidatus Altiarchaeales archaeon]